MALQWLLQIGLYAVGVLIVIGVMLGLPALMGERHGRKPERQSELAAGIPYESGVQPTGTTHIRFPIQYYLVAMFFVIFDLEAVFLYAWALAVEETGWLGFVEAVIFVVILLAALAYLWLIGALDWNAHYQRPRAHRLSRLQPKERPDAHMA